MYLDAEAPQLVRPHYAVVNVRRGARKRFSASSVELKVDATDALAAADPAQDLHAAEVIGPSRSAEGFRIYYLVRWLD